MNKSLSDIINGKINGDKNNAFRHPIIHSIVQSYAGDYDSMGFFYGQGRAEFVDGRVHVGRFTSGKIHGYGKSVWKDETVYEGSFENNAIEGEGTYEWKANNAIYSGGVKNGMRHGYGAMTAVINNINHCSYYGDWKNGKKHGKGIMWYSSGNRNNNNQTENIETSLNNSNQIQIQPRYDGDWVDDKKNGMGLFVYESGNVYFGEWVNDKRNGYGLMMWIDKKERYLGEWRDGEPNGNGQYVWFLPSHHALNDFVMCNNYVGNFVDGKRDGFGTYTFASGAQYVGEWKNNTKNGQGVFSFEDGSIFEGEFIDDSFNGFDKQKHQVDEILLVNLNHVKGFQTETTSSTTQANAMLEAIRKIIQRFVSELHQVYRIYSNVLGSVFAAQDFDYRMMRIHFHKLMLDSFITTENFTLHDIDVAIGYHYRTSRFRRHFADNPHDPWQPLLYREFLEWLIYVASAKPTWGKSSTMIKEPLHKKLAALIIVHIIPTIEQQAQCQHQMQEQESNHGNSNIGETSNFINLANGNGSTNGNGGNNLLLTPLNLDSTLRPRTSASASSATRQSVSKRNYSANAISRIAHYNNSNHRLNIANNNNTSNHDNNAKLGATASSSTGENLQEIGIFSDTASIFGDIHENVNSSTAVVRLRETNVNIFQLSMQTVLEKYRRRLIQQYSDLCENDESSEKVLNFRQFIKWIHSTILSKSPNLSSSVTCHKIIHMIKSTNGKLNTFVISSYAAEKISILEFLEYLVLISELVYNNSNISSSNNNSNNNNEDSEAAVQNSSHTTATRSTMAKHFFDNYLFPISDTDTNDDDDDDEYTDKMPKSLPPIGTPLRLILQWLQRKLREEKK